MIKNIFVKHWMALVFAIIVGVISVAPHFLAVHAIGSDYQGIPFMYQDDEDIYLGRIHEILDGHFAVSSPYFFEYKNTPIIVPPIGEYVYALPSLIFGISLTSVVIFTKFLFPLILFLLVYVLVSNLICKSNDVWERIHAVSAGLVVTLGFDLTNIPYALNLFLGKIHEVHTSLWTREVNPITGALFLFVFLIVLWRSINKKSKRNACIAGIILVLMSGYFFSFGLAFCVLSVLIILLFLKKEYQACRDLAITFVIGILGLTPYLINALSSLGSLEGREAAMRAGMLYIHTPLFNKVVIVAITVFVSTVIYLRRKSSTKTFDRRQIFLTALVGGSFLALNQQVLTGRAVWPYHFVQYTIPLSIISIFVCVFYCLHQRSERLLKSFSVLFIFLSLGMGVLSVGTYAYALSDFRSTEGFASAFEFLNTDAPKDCVVLADTKDEKLSKLIPAFTHCDVYTSSYTFTAVTKERILHNFLVDLRLKNISPDNIEDYLNKNEIYVREYFFEDWQQLFAPNRDPRIEPVIQMLTLAYKDFYKNDFSAELNKYKLDYIVSDKELEKNIVTSLPQFVFVKNLDGLFVYKKTK